MLLRVVFLIKEMKEPGSCAGKLKVIGRELRLKGLGSCELLIYRVDTFVYRLAESCGIRKFRQMCKLSFKRLIFSRQVLELF